MATKAKSKTNKTKTSKKAIKNIAVKQPKKLPGAFELFSPSKDAFVKNIGIFLAIFFIPLLILMGGGLLAFSLIMFALSTRSVEIAGLSALLFFIVAVVALVAALIFAPALPYTQIKSIRGEVIGLKEAFNAGLHYFWRFLGLSISVGIVVFVGLLLFIVPGIIFIRRYFLSAYFLVDQDLKVFESMRRSSATTKGHSGAVWGVIGVNILFGLVGIIPYLGGIASAILQALYLCAPALRYEQLKNSN